LSVQGFVTRSICHGLSEILQGYLRKARGIFRLQTSDFGLYYMPIPISALISSLGPYLPLADTSGQIWESRDDIRADMDAVVLSCCACKAPHFVILQLELVLNFDFYLLQFPSTARKKLSYLNTCPICSDIIPRPISALG
jgi:hypothetical protein